MVFNFVNNLFNYIVILEKKTVFIKHSYSFSTEGIKSEGFESLKECENKNNNNFYDQEENKKKKKKKKKNNKNTPDIMIIENSKKDNIKEKNNFQEPSKSLLDIIQNIFFFII